MNTGTGTVHGPGTFTVLTIEPFAVYLLRGKKRMRILGPLAVTDRRLTFTLAEGDHVEVVTEGDWSVTGSPRVHHKEKNNGVPVELGIPTERPLSLREEMQRYIRNEISIAAAARGYETVDEANDFDIDDEEDLPSMTGYEILEMPEEYLLEKQEVAADNGGSAKSKGEGDATRPVQNNDSQLAAPTGASPEPTPGVGEVRDPAG